MIVGELSVKTNEEGMVRAFLESDAKGMEIFLKLVQKIKEEQGEILTPSLSAQALYDKNEIHIAILVELTLSRLNSLSQEIVNYISKP